VQLLPAACTWRVYHSEHLSGGFIFERAGHAEQRFLRQYLCFCTSKASKLCTQSLEKSRFCDATPFTRNLSGLCSSVCVSIRRHTSAYVSIRQHKPAYAIQRCEGCACPSLCMLVYVCVCVCVCVFVGVCVCVWRHAE